MGADQFFTRANGATAKEAFSEAVEEAQWEHGHGGYTGTIAEKHSFVMSRKPDSIPAETWADMVDEFDEDDTDQEYYYELKRDFKAYDDKWGPALCIEDDGGFIFCGWASS